MPADKGSIALDLDHVDLDVEAFLDEAAAASRLARSGDAGDRPLEAGDGRGAVRRRLPRGGPIRGLGGALREEAQATYIAIARSLAEAAAVDGDADGATRYYLRILERDPYDEGAHLGLVVGAGRGRTPRRGPAALRVLRGEDGGDRRRGGAVPGVDGEWRRGSCQSPGSFAAAPG